MYGDGLVQLVHCEWIIPRGTALFQLEEYVQILRGQAGDRDREAVGVG